MLTVAHTGATAGQALPNLQEDGSEGTGGLPGSTRVQARVQAQLQAQLQAQVLSTVAHKGSRCWTTWQGPLDAAACVDFLRRLTQGRAHEVFLMRDLTPVVQAEALAEWLDEHDEIVEFGCPPSQRALQVRPDRIWRVFIVLISQSHRRLLI